MGRPGGLLLLLLLARGGAGAEPCEPQATCEACVRSHPRCAWCEDPDFPRGGQGEAARCAPRQALERAGCPPGAVVEPRGSVWVLRDEELGAGGDRGGAPNQLRPQSVRLLLRPGEERSFQVRFRRVRGHPVDLYYLMDLSYSMRDDLRNLRRLGRDLLAALRNVTPSVRIGFGSFVDKPVLPYVSTAPSKLRSPCPGRGEPCDPPTAFRHVLSLTPDAQEFARRVGRQRISGNLDAAEAGFDAIMQVALCQERIGWRPVTRLLLVASDDAFHSAGDGKLGGIVLPSDTRCHLDAAGVYAQSHLYDYPSVGHLAQVLAATNIQPIFAVTAPTLPVYQELSRLLPRSVVGELREDSSNVVQLIADAYDSLSSRVELQHSPLPPGISLSYESHCGGCLGGGGGECSGHGRCVCGTCRCQPGYLGPLCGHCPSCPTPCQRLRDCAECKASGRGGCGGACARVTARLLPAPPPGPPSGWCRERTQDGRPLLFLIEGGARGGEEEGDGEVTLTIWAEQGGTGAPGGLVAGLVAGTVTLGLVALGSYRLLLELRDRREFRRFQRERRDARWHQDNPLFRSATTTTLNPGYRPG